MWYGAVSCAHNLAAVSGETNAEIDTTAHKCELVSSQKQNITWQEEVNVCVFTECAGVFVLVLLDLFPVALTVKNAEGGAYDNHMLIVSHVSQ